MGNTLVLYTWDKITYEADGVTPHSTEFLGRPSVMRGLLRIQVTS